MSFVEIEHLTIEYNTGEWNSRKALDDVSLTVQEGDLVFLSGHNGSGKSSLLRALCGELVSTAIHGNMSLQGQPLGAMSMLERARAVALVDQDPTEGTCAHLMVQEQLALVGKDVAARVGGRLKAIGSTIEMGQRIRDLSGGQRQLLTVLMALERRPTLLLADEPTAALDKHFAPLVLSLIMERRGQTGMATILVSHSMDDLQDDNEPFVRHVGIETMSTGHANV